MIASGYNHSLILTKSGLVYSFGSNSDGQLGVPSKRNSSVPLCIQDISHIPMSYVAAGSFSASISAETGSLYLWGTGTFGEFHSPHRVKKITERVSQVQIGHQFGIALSDSRILYSWGENTKGQLGTGDFQNLSGPTKMD
jgi:alpha-tubulin suppressor-like RCC1 family protein